MNLYVRCAMIAIASVAVAGCQAQNTSKKFTYQLASSDPTWAVAARAGSFDDEPDEPSWGSGGAGTRASAIGSIRAMARRLAPAGADITRLSNRVGKRRSVKIACIPDELTMILNTVAWHYGKRVHIQSGYRSKRHNRRVGGAKHSYHLRCEAADIQVQGVDKYELAKFLKGLPGRGGVGTYCNVSTVHIDVGPKRAWHWGCRKRSARRYARNKRRR